MARTLKDSSLELHALPRDGGLMGLLHWPGRDELVGAFFKELETFSVASGLASGWVNP